MNNSIISSKELAPIKSRITKMQTMVESLIINDEKTQTQATNILSGIKSVAKEIKTKKEEITKPMNDALKATRTLFAPLETSYKEAEVIVKKKMVDYFDVTEKERIEKETKLAAKVDKGTMKIETAAKKMEELPEVKTHVDTGKGSATVKKVKMFKVEDLSKVPISFHLPNMVAIRQSMNNGEQIEGVKYWEESSISAR